MRRTSTNAVYSTNGQRARELARVQPILLVVVCFLIGLGAGAFWFHRATGRGAVGLNSETADLEAVALSDSTKAVLQRLDSPIEIRFYALLDPASVSDSLKDFASRVDQLLSAYQQEANGKIKVTRHNSPSESSASAASADGIKPFNLDKGDACYLGLAVVHDGQKESLSQISPEWGQALESDLSRAIVRLISASSPVKPLVASSEVDPAAIMQVKRAIPNLASVSVEEGTRILREAALEEFKVTMKEMEIQVKEAQQRLSQAQDGGSVAEQQAALKHLQQTQANQAEKLQQIAAGSKAQIEALQQLKATAR